MNNQPVIAVTSGEPAGIGPDICLDLANPDVATRIVVLGDLDLLQQRAQMVKKRLNFNYINLKINLCLMYWKSYIFQSSQQL